MTRDPAILLPFASGHCIARARRCGQIFALAILSTACVLACCNSAFAHEKWFTGARPTNWDQLLAMPQLALVAGAVLVTLGAAALWRVRGQRDFLPGPEAFGATPSGRARFYSWVPAILALHVAVPLLVYGLDGDLFSPNNALPGASKYWLGLLQTTAALSLFYGGMTRLGAALLAVTWLSGIFLLGLEPMMENTHYLGFATFFFLAGRGPISIDRLLFPKLEPSENLMVRALPALRVGVGISLVMVAFTEKLANLPLAMQFLKEYPLNFTDALGIPLSDETFVLCCGDVELLVGLFILFGLFPRTIIVIAWLPFNLTLTIFNWVELVGHLPFYGALAVLLIFTPSEEDQRLWVEGVRGTSSP
jgi:uncharacterized membrane protein YphA (DoxX/SURF4 family)